MRYFFIPLLSILFVACHATNGDKSRPPQPVKCTTAQSLRSLNRDFAALSTADDAVNLAFKLSGRVVDIPVAKGMAVKQGELLARLDSRDVELQLSAARAAYDEAVSRLNRAERLLAHNAISEQEVESLRNAAVQAEAAKDNAESLLADTRIVAPFDGVVERTYVDAFQRVASGETIVRIVKPRSTTVGFTAPESLVPVLSNQATRYSVVFDAYPEVYFTAVIKSFARTSSDALGFPVSLRLTDVGNYAISPGMTCIAIVSVEEDSTAVVLPLSAIYAPVGSYDSVWVVDAEGRVERRRVTLGSLTGSADVVVLSGVEAGERVVTAGVYQLTEGERVKVII
ncbi:MAG: efflux RND transporter periplasmic adaptor subunit [Alistipes sp.]|nr:efflux RND transporter periplasmic adaptor subunit [Alistipes sp.]